MRKHMVESGNDIDCKQGTDRKYSTNYSLAYQLSFLQGYLIFIVWFGPWKVQKVSIKNLF